MDTPTQNFSQDELVMLGLRRLFEMRGFCRVQVGKFEEYALYIENKNFLNTDSIITFMDVDGKLMALKPDVTLSIVKNIPRKALPAAQKLYYIDDVYRLSLENREYKVLGQIGVELIGGADDFSNLEIIDLAAQSLGIIGKPYALDISHLGFVSGLLREMGLSHRVENMLLENIHTKNLWDIQRILGQLEAPQEKTQSILDLASIHGEFASSLEQAKELICNDQMQAAYQDLAQVGTVLRECRGGSVNLDFSVVNHLDYYNGLIFRGYVEGVPSLVLTGGRYDNLMKKMKKENGAIGFAINLDELGTYLKEEKRPDFDLLITYPEDCDFAELLEITHDQNEKGVRVRLEREGSDTKAAGIVAPRHLRYIDGKLEEVSPC